MSRGINGSILEFLKVTDEGGPRDLCRGSWLLHRSSSASPGRGSLSTNADRRVERVSSPGLLGALFRLTQYMDGRDEKRKYKC